MLLPTFALSVITQYVFTALFHAATFDLIWIIHARQNNDASQCLATDKGNF